MSPTLKDKIFKSSVVVVTIRYPDGSCTMSQFPSLTIAKAECKRLGAKLLKVEKIKDDFEDEKESSL